MKNTKSFIHTAFLLCFYLFIFSIKDSLAEIVIIVNQESSINTLNSAQASNIFLVKTYTFPDGNTAIPVDLIEGNPLRNEFYAKAAQKDASQVKSYWSRLIFTGKRLPPIERTTPEEVKLFVAKTPGAIGYINKKLVDSSVKVVLELK